MNYNQALEYLFAVPMFQNRGKEAYNPSVATIGALCTALGEPQHRFKSIHIAGTNGKGSTAHLLAATFKAAGYKTGLYTSPHIFDFRERIKIDGELVSEEFIARFFTQNLALLEEYKPSFFEITTILAFQYFAEQEVDIAIIECGLGGRLDATNLINPLVSIITNISYDHANLLGETLLEIATEKGGIIKPQVPLVLGEFNFETTLQLISMAKKVEAPFYIAPQRYNLVERNFEGVVQQLTLASPNLDSTFTLATDLNGLYQEHNVITTLTALDIIEEVSDFKITTDNIREGFTSTKLNGRWQQIGDSPKMVCDTGHNCAGIEFVARQLELQQYETLYFVLGVVADKDLAKILPLLPQKCTYIFTQPSIPRALNYLELEQKAAKFGLTGFSAPTVAEAIEIAKSKASKNDFIFVGGSTFVVSDALQFLGV